MAAPMRKNRRPLTTPTKYTSSGFTLVELLVVIGIIAVLISILLPSLSKARAAALTLQCQSNMRQLGVAFTQYTSENRGRIVTHSQAWLEPAPGNPAQWWSYSVDWIGLVHGYIGPKTDGLTRNQRDPATFNLSHRALFCPIDAWFPVGSSANDWWYSRDSSYGIPYAVLCIYDGRGRDACNAPGFNPECLMFNKVRQSSEVVLLGESNYRDLNSPWQYAEPHMMLAEGGYYYSVHGRTVQNWLFFDGHMESSKLPPHPLGYWFPWHPSKDIQMMDGTVIDASTTSVSAFQQKFP